MANKGKRKEELVYRNQKFAFMISYDFGTHLNQFTLEEKGMILDWIFKIATSRRNDPEYQFTPEEIPDRAIQIYLWDFDRLNSIAEQHYLVAIGQNSTGGKNSHKGSIVKSTSVDLTDIDKEKGNEIVIEMDMKDFSPPSLSEIKSFCEEQKLRVDPEKFFNYYEAQNWMIGKTRITNWRAKIKGWAKNDFGKNSGSDIQHSPIERDPELDDLF